MLRTILIKQSERKRMNSEKQRNYNKMDDIPYIDAADPESSFGHHHNANDIVAPAANELDVLPDDDEKANFRNGIPAEIESKLEESLSVESMDEHGMEVAPPPPPSDPIPDDILLEHAQRKKHSRALSLNLKKKNTFQIGASRKETEMHKIDSRNKKLKGIASPNQMGMSVCVRHYVLLA